MRRDVSNRHIRMDQHTGKTGMIKIDIEAIEKVMINQEEEFKRKLEFGTIISNFIEKQH